MKPRIFVSSTYYDLKYIRDNIERFISQYGFEPVLFETGNVTYEHESQMDESCYNEVKLCHMMILIIGGRYGNPASGENKQDLIDKYENSYISITRKEYKTAREKRIPIYVFIDKNVYAEYQTYKENSQLFFSLNSINEAAATSDQDSLRKFKFAHVDSINVFEFINELKSIPMQSFDSFEDIADYLQSQWAGLFYLYLSDIQNNKQKDEILGSVADLKNISSQMKTMLDEVGKSILGDSENYKSVIESQNIKLIKYFAETFFKSVELVTTTSNESDLIATSKILFNDYLDSNLLADFRSKKYKRNSLDLSHVELLSSVNEKLLKVIKDSSDKLRIQHIEFINFIEEYFEEIKPIFNQNKSKYSNVFIEKLSKLLIDEYLLPF